jgi:hypothetical protein
LLTDGLNALSDKNPSGCWLVQPTNQIIRVMQMVDFSELMIISLLAH